MRTAVMKKELFNTGWGFCKKPLGTSLPAVILDHDFTAVEIPHDWLIFNTHNLYESEEGWYCKYFNCPVQDDSTVVSLRFEGVYMDSTFYMNGQEIFAWKYGYSTFEFDITPYLVPGKNEIIVRVVHQSPNSRWYSGAGIYRNVWLITRQKQHFYPDGVYVSVRRQNEQWRVFIDSIVVVPENTSPAGLSVRHSIADKNGTLLSGAVDSLFDETRIFCPFENKEIAVWLNSCELSVSDPALWDIDAPNLYTLTSELIDRDRLLDQNSCKVGFRTAEFTPEDGFLLNGRKLRIRGVCEHHDLGCLGSAVNRTAIKRKLLLLKEMGVNAIRTSHNMPAVELMELADELGFLVDSEAFDMWEHSKTTYDYARFFKEWCRRDVAAWIRRDRNHPSVILWSIGNEIYDTHADAHGQEITSMLAEYVRQNDPRANAPVTIGSNYMPWEGAQKCADLIKYAGYNYSEKYYEEHHKKHPDWIIYGSETSSVVQSRGIYHFPYLRQILSDDDEQCSSLGNSAMSWGAKSTLACIADDRDAYFSAGQFVWTGFDYIGEPTPYHTKNSYFGQIDTAGFPKDSFYIFQAEWTNYKEKPMIHLFPYWDFNEGQLVDLLVCSNAPKVELFFNNTSLGTRLLDHEHGRDDLLAHWQAAYQKGTIRAVAYDENDHTIAEDSHSSFGEAASLCIAADRDTLRADGKDLAFLTITANDADGNPVENANLRVKVSVSGAGRLLGLDNGDSTDFEQYKCADRRLFSGKLLAVIGSIPLSGEILVTVSSEGLSDASLTLFAREMTPQERAEEENAGVLIPENAMLLAVPPSGPVFLPADALTNGFTLAFGLKNLLLPSDKPIDPSIFPEELQKSMADFFPEQTGIPVRRISLTSDHGFTFSPEVPSMEITAVTLPENAADTELIWKVTTDDGIDSNLAALDVHSDGRHAKVTALGDGNFRVRCMTKNGTDKVRVISELYFTGKGLGSAAIDPYCFVSAGLYDIADGTVTAGNEHGVSISRGENTTIGFSNVDFGDFGSDEITISIFAMDGTPCPIQIWEGVPGEKNAELLADVIYQKPAIWNVYQEQTFRLKRRIKGTAALCFTARDQIHIKGFIFAKPQKAYAKLSALEHSRIYGDTFTIAEEAVTGIGNNVSLEYDNMDFGEKEISKLTICGRTPLAKNTIHIRFAGSFGEVKQIAEFTCSDQYTEQQFSITGVTGKNKVSFVFLPGCDFDFRWFQFE